MCAMCASGGDSSEHFSFRKEKTITRKYATMIPAFRFDAAQGSHDISANRGSTDSTKTARNSSVDAENVCRGKNFNKEPRAPLNLNKMNHLSDELNHRRNKVAFRR